MFDAPCAVCDIIDEEDDDGEVRVMTEEEVQNEQIREWVLDHVDD